MEEEDETEMFRMGENADFEGLAAAGVVPETMLDLLTTGRDVRVNEVLGEGIEQADDNFDRDVGESSRDED